ASGFPARKTRKNSRASSSQTGTKFTSGSKTADNFDSHEVLDLYGGLPNSTRRRSTSPAHLAHARLQEPGTPTPPQSADVRNRRSRDISPAFPNGAVVATLLRWPTVDMGARTGSVLRRQVLISDGGVCRSSRSKDKRAVCCLFRRRLRVRTRVKACLQPPHIGCSSLQPRFGRCSRARSASSYRRSCSTGPCGWPGRT